jgi:hypothetical protein
MNPKIIKTIALRGQLIPDCKLGGYNLSVGIFQELGFYHLHKQHVEKLSDVPAIMDAWFKSLPELQK